MPKFRKKPVVIEAEQWVDATRVKGMCDDFDCLDDAMAEHVHTIHDNQAVIVKVGDWIIPESDGIHFYPCKPDIFAATYEPAKSVMDTDSEFQAGFRAGLREGGGPDEGGGD